MSSKFIEVNIELIYKLYGDSFKTLQDQLCSNFNLLRGKRGDKVHDIKFLWNWR